MADDFETGDPSYIAKLLGVFARASGMTEIPRETGLSKSFEANVTRKPVNKGPSNLSVRQPFLA